MPRERTTGSLEWVGDPDAPKPVDHWRCRVWNDGKRQWIKLPPTIRHDQRAKAEKKAHELAAAARAGKVPRPAAKTPPDSATPAGATLKEWGAEWFKSRKASGKKSTRPDESKWTTWVVPRLGKTAMAAITRAEVEAWVEWIDRQVRADKLAWKPRRTRGGSCRARCRRPRRAR
jgi:hypothetical protein